MTKDEEIIVLDDSDDNLIVVSDNGHDVITISEVEDRKRELQQWQDLGNGVMLLFQDIVASHPKWQGEVIDLTHYESEEEEEEVRAALPFQKIFIPRDGIDQIKIPAQTKDQVLKLIELSEKTLIGQKAESIEYILNARTADVFDMHLNHAVKLKKKHTVEFLFHGTKTVNVDSITREGFKIGGVNGHPSANGASHGKERLLKNMITGNGIYCSRSPAIPIGYSDNQSLIVSRALILDQIDFVSNNAFCVIRESGRMMPLFVIRFEYLPGMNWQLNWMNPIALAANFPAAAPFHISIIAPYQRIVPPRAMTAKAPKRKAPRSAKKDKK